MTFYLFGMSVAARLRREGYDWREQLRALSTPALVLHQEGDALPATVASELSEIDAFLAPGSPGPPRTT